MRWREEVRASPDSLAFPSDRVLPHDVGPGFARLIHDPHARQKLLLAAARLLGSAPLS